MRILFLHAAWNGLRPEYRVHLSLATNSRATDFVPYFIWQSPTEIDLSESGQIQPHQIITHDFGRNMSIETARSRYSRPSMIIRKLPRTLIFLDRVVKQVNPDVIYTSQQALDIRLANIISRYFGIPHVIHIHYSVGPWLGKFALNTIQKSSYLVAISEYVRQTALLRGVLPANIHTIVNPAPLPQTHIQQNDRTQDIRAEYNLNNSPLIVAVGRLDPGKGHLNLFEAFAEVIKKSPDARLLLCGVSTFNSGYENVLRQRVHELGIEPYTIFAGYRSNISTILQSADVFCLPAELEPFGLVYLEAMMAGLPVIACHSGGVPEIVLHNQTGLLSYPNDTSALAENLLATLSDKKLAQRLGEAGKQRAYKKFSAGKIADQWLDVVHRKIVGG